eukprot:UN03638
MENGTYLSRHTYDALKISEYFRLKNHSEIQIAKHWTQWSLQELTWRKFELLTLIFTLIFPFIVYILIRWLYVLYGRINQEKGLK